ncbi:MAG: dephospho-CoA kinase [Methylococcaceae bacterium]
MLKIGLTGGIGCGKSTATDLFAKLGAPVIDADHIAHRLVEKGQPALNLIQQVFGAETLTPDGSLDRKSLRNIIFSDHVQKVKLESILHPLIYDAIRAEAKQINAPYCIICIPLLFETGMIDTIDRVLVIDCPVEVQIARVSRRDHLDAKSVQSILDNQVSRAFRIANADDLIDNSETDETLAEQIKKLHNLYLSISNSQD